MNIIVVIKGREAIPVRAIPLHTDWARMSPDEIAAVLADGADSWPFNGLTAYRNEDGEVRSIVHTWWNNDTRRKLGLRGLSPAEYRLASSA